MGADRRVKKFEEWSREHGRSSRESDRRRVALELYEISGGDSVEESHVDTLAKKYRDGLMGANAILHARAVAEDLLAWQEEAGGTDDRAEEEPVRASERPPASLSARPPPREEPAPERSKRSELPPPKQASVAPAARSERPPRWQDAALGRHESKPLSRSDIPARGDRHDSGSAPPPRRSEAPGIGTSRMAESKAPEPAPRGGSEPPARGRGGAAGSLPPAKPAAGDLFDDLDDLGAGDRPISSVPPARHATPSGGPRRLDSDRPRRSSPIPRASSRPPKAAPSDDFEEVVDRAPKKLKPGFDRAPSVRPSASLPDVESSEEGVDRSRAAQRSDVLTESVAPPPRSVPPKLAIYEGDAPKPLSRRLMMWGALAVPVVGILGFALTRPGCSPFVDSRKQVGGPFRSKHLGIELNFTDQWLHDESKDDSEEKEGWNRRVSVFFRGTSSTDFLSQFVLVVYSRGDKRAGTTDANQLGANETMGMVMSRSCSPFKHPSGEVGTICSAFTARGMQRLAMIEAYFPLDGRAVFARFLLEVPLGAPPMAAPEPGADGPGAAVDEMQSVLERKLLDASVVLSSIRMTR